jgi:hypothetical protein
MNYFRLRRRLTGARLARDLSRRTIVCPCHDATLYDLQHSWASGFTHPETLKRATAVFMGPCQGKYCSPLVGQILAELEGRAVQDGQPTSGPSQRRPTARPPLYPVRLGDLAAQTDSTPAETPDTA